ncbi:LPS O-antigen chain length determinant protein WzzB [Aeromonas fluvialis]|uniref:LPS O-antigen chain length determinant protein WzzB n=1 Tax=Aeromonas fluvialis TaxID=591962 RepID=UPI0005A66FC7|nr:Wzz/FepE/Etk N-terminal domain-containing protein [Aeromonas fluvialis]
MTDNRNMPPSMAAVPPGWQAPQDEIDLRELILVLWRQKVLIMVITLIFAVAGVAYALTAAQVWSAKAVIIGPKSEDLLAMRRVSSQAGMLGLKGFPAGKSLHSQFLLYFNAYENRRDYLRQSTVFQQMVQEQQLDAKAQRRWIREWAKSISAEPVDKKGEKPGTELTFSADTAEHSLALLQGYIDYVIAIQRQELLTNLKEEQALQLADLQQRYKLLHEDAERAMKRDIANTALSNEVAKAAGVASPLENYNNGDRFAITLGTKGLEEKLKVLKSMSLAEYQPKLIELEVQMSRLKSVSLDGLAFRPFSYLETPDEPLTRDKPKRPLIVVLATLLGGMLGVGIVLVRHAFRRPQAA